MPETESAVESLAGSASETLSQLLARILDQLALSAWLPSAALALLTAYIIKLGSVLDTALPNVKPGGKPTYIHKPGVAISRTFDAFGHTSIGGLLLLIAVIVVLTMLTQAFSFESIRVMEGYWGTNGLLERIARRRCDHHRKARQELDTALKELTEQGWNTADRRIRTLQDELHSRGKPVVWTPNMRAALGSRVLRTRVLVPLTEPDEKRRVKEADWKQFADPELLRRRVNVQKRLRDYPELAHVLPTHLGNVLRHHEDKTGRSSVESLVDEVFDSLPFSLRVSHDEQRSRLDLYCSMVFVLGVVGVTAVARFLLTHWGYAVGAVCIVGLLALVSYRAAVASARAYGSILITISRYAKAPAAAAPTPAPTVP